MFSLAEADLDSKGYEYMDQNTRVDFGISL